MNEFEADKYVVDHSPQHGKHLIEGLKKLSKDNLSNLNPHPFYVFMTYTHPPVLERIRVLRDLSSSDSETSALVQGSSSS